MKNTELEAARHQNLVKSKELEIARYQARRGSSALLDIEALCIKGKEISNDPEIGLVAKSTLLGALIGDIYNKVIEGTESKFIAKK